MTSLEERIKVLEDAILDTCEECQGKVAKVYTRNIAGQHKSRCHDCSEAALREAEKK